MENGPDKSNLFFLPKSEPKPKSELEKKAETRLTMENVGEVFEIASTSTNPDDKPIWANNSISHKCFYEESLNKCRGRIAKLVIQLQPRFFKSPGFDYTSAVYNELQERWDSSVGGVYALQLLTLAKATDLGDVTTSRAEINDDPRTPILFLGDRKACDKIILTKLFRL